MGGHGSGRPRGWAQKGLATSQRALDVRSLHRRGILAHHGEIFSLSWSHAGRIDVRPQRDLLLLSYCCKAPGSGGELCETAQVVRLTWTVPHYGGRRPWFRCPACAGRVAKLYAGERLACRNCAGLVYPSQNEDLYQRRIRRARKIRRRLGGQPRLVDPYPGKPKGMHWHTYNRLLQELEEAQIDALLLLVHNLERADRRIANLNLKCLSDGAAGGLATA